MKTKKYFKLPRDISQIRSIKENLKIKENYRKNALFIMPKEKK